MGTHAFSVLEFSDINTISLHDPGRVLLSSNGHAITGTAAGGEYRHERIQLYDPYHGGYMDYHQDRTPGECRHLLVEFGQRNAYVSCSCLI